MIGREIIRLQSTGSTMDDVATLAADGAAEGVVVVADVQTAGRGRSGRAWTAPPGSSLLMSVLLRPEIPAERLPSLSLVAAVAVSEALERFGLNPTLKWPNDVWLDGRKVAGILVGTRVGPAGIAAIVGIGVNVNLTSGDLPPGATSMSVVAGAMIPRDDVLNAVLTRLDAAYRAFTSATDRQYLEEWTKRAALIGEQVHVSDGGSTLSGSMLGIAADGALLLRGEAGETIRIVAGDLTRGPRTIGGNG